MLWSKTYETGIREVDEQHMELFAQIDILLDRSKENRMKETLDFLEKYVIRHFDAEQGYHARSNYPKAARHKKYHEAFVAEYKKLKDRFNSEGPSLTVHQAINKTVLGWLREHIMTHDKEFASYYKQQ